ncbi:protein of unknown function [Maridesulfovibrio ferrireducens]|uniref:DUF4145 domain-containing protein n=1 Tax=Maridesulfovibrio ferrireducens TaxID=246191 RepID=A0A1G9FXU2_9BACT|nr:DUF4145 domain-containing protein [Maridesulfovibrio ferrireducens]SDK93271.1 protein of unknown function [Maridesulfovibrio ferrireducens]
MVIRSKPATVSEKSFNCPCCGAYTSQSWKKLYIEPVGEDGTPFFPAKDFRAIIEAASDVEEDQKNATIDYCEKVNSGIPFLEKQKNSHYSRFLAGNIHLSECYACKKIAVWVYDKLIYPAQKYQVDPNSDMPDDVRCDFEEAALIVNDSPRGAAALLRLAIQKLCKHLGKPGKNINADIASLVQDGLDPMIQKALDVVRIVGNAAVHPAEINLNDNKDIAYQLFSFVNIIVKEMISRPKEIQESFYGQSSTMLEAIEKRDNGKKK